MTRTSKYYSIDKEGKKHTNNSIMTLDKTLCNISVTNPFILMHITTLITQFEEIKVLVSLRLPK